ncbi:hypothetical protein FACS189467_8310 [Bacteroidia bacterium]|nr:hypothetical protein FACS189467_8310 [Bacteroidia bacterium]
MLGVLQHYICGKSWDVKWALTKLGQELFGERFQQLDGVLHQQLSDKQFLQNYFRQRESEVSVVDKKLQQIAQQARQYMQQNGYTIDDFPYKRSGFMAHFEHLAEGKYEVGARTKDAVNRIEKWSTKGAKKDITDAYNALNPLLDEAVRYWEEQEKTYNTAKLICTNFMQLGLLTDMAMQVQRIVRENNVLPLSNATRLIAGLIDDNDTPFLYEKIGNNYRSLMIDEFQDTSAGQWKNFLPLLTNSLSSNGFSMVVGDVKQSIYRWRNGDWRILGYINNNEALKKFGNPNVLSLNENWRSYYNIVHFNNVVIAQSKDVLQGILRQDLSAIVAEPQCEQLLQMLDTSYADVKQIPRTKSANNGFVRVEFVPDSEDENAHDIILSRLPENLKHLRDKGYKASDIAILVRDKKDARAIMDTLLSYKQQNADAFDVISQDALQLNSSTLVRICIALLRIAAGQEDALNEAFLQYEMYCIKNETQDSNALHRLFSQPLVASEKDFLHTLTMCSLPEAFEKMVQHYDLHNTKNVDELPFLQALFDLIIQFANKKLSDVGSFLQWWDEQRGCETSLSCNDGQDAVMVSTIHKSKGLEYKVVLMPFCDWDLNTKANSTIWMHNDNAPFNEIKQLPLPYNNLMSRSFFAQQYAEEKTQAFVDSLNLLYVALTRAKEQLHVFVSTGKSAAVGKISYVLETVFAQFNLADFEIAQAVQEGANVFEFGQKENTASPSQQETQPSIKWDKYFSSGVMPKVRIKRSANVAS